MKRKRRAFTEQFKAGVALEALKEVKTLSELATEYKVHPNQISAWKKQLLNHAQDIFESGKTKACTSEEELTAPLYEEIGRLKMDIKWLKKSWDHSRTDTPGLGAGGREILDPEAMRSGGYFPIHLLSHTGFGKRRELADHEND